MNPIYSLAHRLYWPEDIQKTNQNVLLANQLATIIFYVTAAAYFLVSIEVLPIIVFAGLAALACSALLLKRTPKAPEDGFITPPPGSPSTQRSSRRSLLFGPSYGQSFVESPGLSPLPGGRPQVLPLGAQITSTPMGSRRTSPMLNLLHEIGKSDLSNIPALCSDAWDGSGFTALLELISEAAAAGKSCVKLPSLCSDDSEIEIYFAQDFKISKLATVNEAWLNKMLRALAPDLNGTLF